METGPLTTVVAGSERADAARWDGFVAATPGGDHVQSSGWARTKASQGYDHLRVIVERDGAIAGGAQVLVRRLRRMGAFGYVPRGPVVAPGDREAADAVITELQRQASARRIRHLVVQPGRNGDWLTARLAAAGFVPSAMSVAPTATLLVDVRGAPEEIFARLSKSARKHVRRADRLGVQIREGAGEDLGTFQSLLAATALRNGFRGYSLPYFETMWEALHPNGHLRLFLAEVDGTAVSAHLVVPFGEALLSKAVAWSGDHAGAYPNERLEWHVIEWAARHGFSFYDLEGIERPTAERLLAHPSTPVADLRPADQFKLKFGGAPVLLPTAHDFFPGRVVAATYGRAYRLAFSGGWPRPLLAPWRTRTPGASRG